MQTIKGLKARFPKLFPIATAVLTMGAIAGVAVYERSAQASDSCCYPGAPCCHPGAACCAGHKHATK